MQPPMNSVLARLNAIDTALCVRINRINRDRAVQRFFGAISRLGDGTFWYALMALLLIVEREAALKPVLHMIAVGLIGLWLYKWLKQKTLNRYTLKTALDFLDRMQKITGQSQAYYQKMSRYKSGWEKKTALTLLRMHIPYGYETISFPLPNEV